MQNRPSRAGQPARFGWRFCARNRPLAVGIARCRDRGAKPSRTLPRAQNRHLTPCQMPPPRKAILHTLRCLRCSDLTGIWSSTTRVRKPQGSTFANRLEDSSQREWGGWDGFPRSQRGCRAVRALRRRACERDRSCGPCWAAAGLLHRPDDAVRAQECRADGGGDGTWADGGATSVAAAFCRQGGLVGRGGLGQGARDGAAGDRAPWAD